MFKKSNWAKWTPIIWISIILKIYVKFKQDLITSLQRSEQQCFPAQFQRFARRSESQAAEVIRTINVRVFSSSFIDFNFAIGVEPRLQKRELDCETVKVITVRIAVATSKLLCLPSTFPAHSLKSNVRFHNLLSKFVNCWLSQGFY